jgi:hypothetical protein
VREVAALKEGSIWMPRRRLLLIDATMDETERASLAEHMVVRAADEEDPS